MVASACAANVERNNSLGENECPTRQFWQRRFYDFNVWSRRKKIEKLNYMHQNPVKRRLVDNPMDWPWSSFAYYQGRENILMLMDPVE